MKSGVISQPQQEGDARRAVLGPQQPLIKWDRQAENDSPGLRGFRRRLQVAGASLNLLAWQPQLVSSPTVHLWHLQNDPHTRKYVCFISVHQEAFHDSPHICCC